MKSADKPAATEKTTDSKMLSSHPDSISTPIVTEMTKKIVKIENKLNRTFNVVHRITVNATTIAIAK